VLYDGTKSAGAGLIFDREAWTWMAEEFGPFGGASNVVAGSARGRGRPRGGRDLSPDASSRGVARCPTAWKRLPYLCRRHAPISVGGGGS
jgi:hypothetical protein